MTVTTTNFKCYSSKVNSHYDQPKLSKFNLVLFFLFTVLTFTNINAQNESDSIVYEFSQQGWGIELGPCTGFGWLFGNAKESIDCNCFANVGIYGIIDQKMHLGVRLGGMSGRLLDDLSFGPEWTNQNLFNSMHLEGFLGINIIDHRRFNIIPFGTFGFKRFNVREGAGEDVSFTNRHHAYSLGIATDIKFYFKIKEKHAFPGSDYFRQAVYFRAKFGVYPRKFIRPFNIRGGLTYLNFSIGYWFSPPGVLEPWL